jgi:hypothetical protein
MASIKPKISKVVDAFIKRHMRFTIPEMLEIIRKVGNATSKSVIMTAYRIGLLTVHNIKKHMEKKLSVRM